MICAVRPFGPTAGTRLRAAVASLLLFGTGTFIAAGGARAQVKLLHKFHFSDGAYPVGSLLLKGHTLYGATLDGAPPRGYGAVYKLTSDGTLTLLHGFASGNDGISAEGNLIMDSEGNLYGATESGGKFGTGIVYKLASDGTETVLYSFGTKADDGAFPQAGLIMDAKGNLYGTTEETGYGTCCGTVFKVKPDRTEIVLHAFSSKQTTDGQFPFASLVMDDQGDLYGTTAYGGLGCRVGCGTVFKVRRDATETVFYAFRGSKHGDGQLPLAGLVMDRKGNFYGTTQYGGTGGCDAGCGTVFKLTPDGTEKVLYSFRGQSDGAFPVQGLVMDRGGNFYGTTTQGGSHNRGTVFRLAPDGTETVMASFSEGQGDEPTGGSLVQDDSGNLYGTAMEGGAKKCSSGCGTVFSLSAGQAK